MSLMSESFSDTIYIINYSKVLKSKDLKEIEIVNASCHIFKVIIDL